VDRLNYLDDSPVFPKDRRLAAAWLKGGVEEEKAERKRIFEDERNERERHRAAFDEMVADARREADEKQRAGVVTERDPYRFMSKEAAEEARMLADGMTEWELEEMRANERLPWQVRERRESEGEVKTSSDRNTSSDASDEPETNEEDEELESRMAVAAEVTGDGDEHIPVAIPIDDDRPGYSSIFVAQVADDEDVAGLVPPAATTDAEPRVTNMTTARDTESAREAAEASAAEELRIELRKMRARHGDRLAETDRAERSRRELERAADSVNANPKLGDSTHRSPVVFGTRAYDQLWAQAKAMGDAAEETGTPLDDEEEEDDERNNEEEDGGFDGANSVNSESVDGVSDYSYGDKENRWERASMASVGATVASTEAGELDGIDEFDETEDDETDGSGSDGTSIDGDPLDRYTVSSVAGKEVGREDADPVDANDELWGLD
jgi:hypothetical protein